MGIAQVCKCGHTKTDHIHRKIGPKKWVNNSGKCSDDTCNCPIFIFDHKEVIGKVNAYLPDAIAPGRYEPLNPSSNKKILSMANLGSDGRPFKRKL